MMGVVFDDGLQEAMALVLWPFPADTLEVPKGEKVWLMAIAVRVGDKPERLERRVHAWEKSIFPKDRFRDTASHVPTNFIVSYLSKRFEVYEASPKTSQSVLFKLAHEGTCPLAKTFEGEWSRQVMLLHFASRVVFLFFIAVVKTVLFRIFVSRVVF